MVTDREFDLLLGQMRQEHEDNLSKFDQILNNHKVFYIWLTILSAIVGGGTAGMYIAARIFG